MATTKITSNVLALSAAQTNINNDGSFTLSVPTQINNTLSLSGNLTVDTNTLFVDSVNNRVGIGTTTPQSTFMLDVNGQVVIRGDNYLNGSLREFGVNAYKLSKTGDSWINGGNVGIGTTTPAVPLQISTIVNGTSLRLGQDATVGRLEFGNINVAINRTSNQLALQGFDGFTFGTQNGEKMRLTSSGNVGIGTTTPNEKLTVVGNISASGTISGSSLTLQNAGTVTLTLNDTAFANIPTFNLQQAGTTRARIEGGVGLTSRMDFSVGLPISRSMSLNQGGTQNYGVTIGRSSVAGNVAPPTDGLHVQGTVAIGTTTPNEKLTVVGNISATGIVTAEGNKLAAETFAIAMAIAVG
jgi:hypothetical protein